MFLGGSLLFLWPVNHLLGHVVWASDGFRVFRPPFERSHVLMLALSVCGTVNSVCMFMPLVSEKSASVCFLHPKQHPGLNISHSRTNRILVLVSQHGLDKCDNKVLNY